MLISLLISISECFVSQLSLNIEKSVYHSLNVFLLLSKEQSNLFHLLPDQNLKKIADRRNSAFIGMPVLNKKEIEDNLEKIKSSINDNVDKKLGMMISARSILGLKDENYIVDKNYID